MTSFSEPLLKETCTLTPSKSLTGRVNQPEWQYPLKAAVSPQYLFSAAQTLLEFSYRVAVHNREVNDGHSDPVHLDPPAFDIVIPLNTEYAYMEMNALWFFYSTTLNIAVVVCTATYNTPLALLDLQYVQAIPKITNYTEGMKVHGGFWSFYSGVQLSLISLLEKYANAYTQVLLTGLSLGGALSTIAALDCYKLQLKSGIILENVIHYSFASPRLFNVIGSNRFTSTDLVSFRSHNGSDIIPIVPLPIMRISVFSSETQDFMHVGELEYFDDNIGSYYDNHITAYLNKYQVTPIN